MGKRGGEHVGTVVEGLAKRCCNTLQTFNLSMNASLHTVGTVMLSAHTPVADVPANLLSNFAPDCESFWLLSMHSLTLLHAALAGLGSYAAVLL